MMMMMRQSFGSQQEQVEKLTKIELTIRNTKTKIDLINYNHRMKDLVLISKVKVIVNNFDSVQTFKVFQMLNDLLKLKF